MSEVMQKFESLVEVLKNDRTSELADLIRASFNEAKKEPEKFTYEFNNPAIDEANDNLYLLSKILRKEPTQLKYYENVYSKLISKAFSAGTTGLGKEFVPQELSTRILEAYKQELRVARLFETINMPSNPYLMPVMLNDPMAIYRTEGTGSLSDQATGTITAALTFTAKTFLYFTRITDEATEDLIAPALPAIKRYIAQSLARALETTIINGDDTGAGHIDADVTVATDARKAFKGLRKYAKDGSLEISAADLSDKSKALGVIRSMRLKMKRFGQNPNNLALIVSNSAFIKLLDTDQVVTYDKFGPNATVDTGVLERIDGIPIIVSEFVREDLATTGVYTTTGLTNTEILMVYTPAFLIGQRGSVKVEEARDISTTSNMLVTSMRNDFEPMLTPSVTYPVVVAGISIAV